MKSILFWGAILLSVLLISSHHLDDQTVLNLPSNEVKLHLLRTLDSIEKKGHVFEETIEMQSPESMREQFLSLRRTFKEAEMLIAYIDPQLFNQSLNGAPLPKIMKHVPDKTIIPPQGLQRMEEVLYAETLAREELQELCTSFMLNLRQFTKEMNHRPLHDADVLEAIRFGIIRLNALGVTGFDAPANTDKSLQECLSYLEGMHAALQPYFSFLKPSTKEQFVLLFGEGKSQLTSQQFDKFDHLAFLMKFSNPMWELTLKAQKELRIELPHLRTTVPMAVNYASDNLYAEDFLNVENYADYVDIRSEDQRIGLGKLLFFDPVLSATNERACASCHQPSLGFSDGHAKSLTTQQRTPGLRNSPTIINSVFADRYFHDVRTDRLSLQMDHVVFHPDEFATNYTEIVEKLNSSEAYRNLFSAAYGSEGITKNSMTNAMAAYVASLRSFNTIFDQYVRGEIQEIDRDIVAGYNLFQGKAGCATCHFAPTFSGNVPPEFLETETEVLGVPSTSKAPYTLDADIGRYGNKIIKEKAPFYRHSFKTPTLRNIALTAPYMHNGVYQTLEEVVDFYNRGGGQGLGLEVEFQTLPGDSLGLTKMEEQQLIAFMQSLTDTVGMTRIPVNLPAFPEEMGLNDRKIGGEY